MPVDHEAEEEEPEQQQRREDPKSLAVRELSEASRPLAPCLPRRLALGRRWRRRYGHPPRTFAG